MYVSPVRCRSLSGFRVGDTGYQTPKVPRIDIFTRLGQSRVRPAWELQNVRLGLALYAWYLLAIVLTPGLTTNFSKLTFVVALPYYCSDSVYDELPQPLAGRAIFVILCQVVKMMIQKVTLRLQLACPKPPGYPQSSHKRGQTPIIRLIPWQMFYEKMLFRFPDSGTLI